MRLEISAIAKKGAREAKKIIFKRGYPIVFARNNKIYYELPNGEISSKIPKEYKGLI